MFTKGENMTKFKKADYSVESLVTDIENGRIALPDLQRPFVWKNAEVRNFFDSLYKGYPVGLLLFWDVGLDQNLREINNNNSDKISQFAIVDGQQRLTSLFAVIKGKEIIRSNFQKDRVRIAFNPLTERFAVADAATDNDKSFISDISEFWKGDSNVFSIAESYLEKISVGREISDDERKKNPKLNFKSLWYSKKLFILCTYSVLHIRCFHNRRYLCSN